MSPPSRRPVFTGLVLSLLLSLLLSPLVLATIGLAEWEIRTPGGHLISHTDGYKEEHGDCLRSDDTDDGEGRIWVSHLRRWRYYDGVVIGESGEADESENHFFLFDESPERLSRFADETALRRALDNRQSGAPLSPWLTGVDGWREAWFPVAVWDACKRAEADGARPAVDLTGEACETALSAERLALMRRTTWGHECRALAKVDVAPDAEEPGKSLAGFCSAVLGRHD